MRPLPLAHDCAGPPIGMFFFTKSSLLYELANDDGAAKTKERANPLKDEEVTDLFGVFQPKRT